MLSGIAMHRPVCCLRKLNSTLYNWLHAIDVTCLLSPILYHENRLMTLCKRDVFNTKERKKERKKERRRKKKAPEAFLYRLVLPCRPVIRQALAMQITVKAAELIDYAMSWSSHIGEQDTTTLSQPSAAASAAFSAGLL